MRGPALLPMLCAAAITAAAILQAQPQVFAQASPPPPQVSRGENFSAKPAPALFASDCTGGGCHRGPQGLAKGRGQTGLAGFLREHYTNSRESAASLANYLLGVPGSAPAEGRTSTRQPQTPAGRGSRAAARPDDDTPAAQPSAPQRRGAEPGEPPKPPARAAARSDDESPQATPASPSPPAAAPGRERRTAEPAQTPPKPSARDRRGRQTTAAPATAPEPAPPAAAPPPQQFDIFD